MVIEGPRPADLSSPELWAVAREASLEVLETMFFELPLEEPSPVQAPAPYHGSLEGTLEVAVARPSSARLAAAFLGLESGEAGEVEQRQVAMELANMLCGATLSRLEPDGRLKIEQPRIVGTAEPESKAWMNLALEDGSIQLALRCGAG
jgi:hypothetical protein